MGEGRRVALLLSVQEFSDPAFRQLVSPSADVEGLERVLSNPAVGGFSVSRLHNCSSQEARLAIEAFFHEGTSEDTLLFFFSGHGHRDALGRLYFVCSDTRIDRLKATSLSAAYVSESAKESLAKSQVLVIDSCFSGAFASGLASKDGPREITGLDLLPGGKGQVVITASTAYQYSFEGSRASGVAEPSVFTKHLISGIATGEADLNNDGIVDLDELYRYVHDKTVAEASQTPQRWIFQSEGTISVARNPNPRQAELPSDIRELIEHWNRIVRVAGVAELEQLARSERVSIAMAGRAKLRELAAEDDSTSVREAATNALNRVSPLSGPTSPPVMPNGRLEQAPPPPPTVTSPKAEATLRQPDVEPSLMRASASRWGFPGLALFVVLGVALLYLSHSKTPGTDSGMPTPPAPAPAPTPGPPTADSVPPSPAIASAETVRKIVRIGHVAPTSGMIAHLGKDNENGARLAVDELNAKGVTIGGAKIKFELVAEDDAADPRQGVAAAQRLVNAKVSGVIGHLNSGTSIPASKIYSDAGIPQISPSATNPKFTRQGLKTTFRIIADDVQLGVALGQLAVAGFKGKSIAVIDDRTAYGNGLAEHFEAGVVSAGSKIAAHEYTTDKSTDFTALLAKVKAVKPDIVFYGGMDAVAGPLFRQAKQLGINAKFMGGDGICTGELPSLAGSAMDDGEVVCAEAGGVEGELKAGLDKFNAKFKARFNTYVQIYAPYTYDAVNVLVAAMVKADSADPAKYLPELARTGGFKGVTGSISFDEKGDVKHGALTLYTYKNNRREQISVFR